MSSIADQSGTLAFTSEELSSARSFYEGRLRNMPRLDFNNRLAVALVRCINPLAHLTSRKARGGLPVEVRRVTAGGHSVKVRIIRPASGSPRGIVVDIHGGGWTLGLPVNDDAVNANLARAGFLTVSVDYRYAPRHTFAELIADCVTATRWVLGESSSEFRDNPVFLHGDSAGAHLSISTALALREDEGICNRLKGLVLLYGNFDLGGSPSLRAAPPDTLVFHGPSLARFQERVTGGLDVEARRAPSISPLFADLSGLPPALLIVGEVDPLIDDSTLMAERLHQAGIGADLHIVPDAPHSFDRFPTPVAERTGGYIRQWLLARCK